VPRAWCEHSLYFLPLSLLAASCASADEQDRVLDSTHSLSLLYTEWSALNVLTHLAFFDPLTKSTVALQQQYFSIFFFSLLQPTVYDPAWTKPHCPSPLRRVSVALLTLVDFSSHLQRCSVVAPFLYFIFLLHPLYFIPSFSSSCHLQHNPRGARISTFL